MKRLTQQQLQQPLLFVWSTALDSWVDFLFVVELVLPVFAALEEKIADVAAAAAAAAVSLFVYQAELPKAESW